jgi:hypothetical protein
MRMTTWWRTPVGVGSPVFGRGRRSSSRRSVAEARWCQSPHFSASLIGLRVRVSGGAAGTVNVGSRAPAKPLFYMALREGGPTATNGRRPRSGRVSDRDPATGSDPEIIPGDHIPTRSTHKLHRLITNQPILHHDEKISKRISTTYDQYTNLRFLHPIHLKYW